MNKSVLRDGCKYNDGVVCKDRSRCYKCGWEPMESKRRSAEIRIGIKHGLPQGLHPACSKCIFLWKYRK